MELAYSNIREMIEKRAADSGDKAYLKFYDDVVTFRQFHERVSRFANGLKSIGVKKGDTVHVYMNNSPEFLYAAHTEPQTAEVMSFYIIGNQYQDIVNCRDPAEKSNTVPFDNLSEFRSRKCGS